MANRGKPEKPRRRQLSVMVLRRTEDAMTLVAAIEANKAKLAAAFAERYAPRLRAGETLPDWELTLELMVRDVIEALWQMIDLDDRVDHAATEADLLREDRDRLVSGELYPRAVTVRGSIDLAFGRKVGSERIHLMKGRTQRKTRALERQLRLALMILADPDRDLPAPKNPHIAVDRDGWVRQLQPGYQKLLKLNHQLGESEAALTSLVVNKRAAVKAFDVAYDDTLRYVQAAYRTAGYDARMIRKLKPYYLRRRLSRLAREKRAARAAAVGKPAPEKIQPPARETARVQVPKTVAKWLEKTRLFGT